MLALMLPLFLLTTSAAPYASLGNEAEAQKIKAADASFGAVTYEQPMEQAQKTLIDIDAYRCEGAENCTDDTETSEFTDDAAINYRYDLTTGKLLTKSLSLDASLTYDLKAFAIGSARKKADVLKNVRVFLAGQKPQCKTNAEQFDPPTYCVYALGKANVIVAFEGNGQLALVRMTFDESI
jgi:hypothetical protein